LGATDVVVGVEQAPGLFGLILESAGGASLATAFTRSGATHQQAARLKRCYIRNDLIAD
jgi:hypothetical protein